jgi:hypothetical protein
MFANRRIGGVKIPCVTWYIVAVLAIIIYGHYIRATGKKDILETKIIDHPSCTGFDGWGLTHFFFFLGLGFMYPGHYLQCLIVSLGWEGIEHCLGTFPIEIGGKRLQLIGEQDEEGKPIVRDENEPPAYWYGRFLSDSFLNVSGFIIGSEVANRWWPNRDPVTGRLN